MDAHSIQQILHNTTQLANGEDIEISDPEVGHASPDDDAFFAGARPVPEGAQDQDFMSQFELAFQKEVLDNPTFTKSQYRVDYDTFALLKLHGQHHSSSNVQRLEGRYW